MYALLVNKQYEQLAVQLEIARQQAVAANDLSQVALLLAAIQVCASCRHLQQEVAFHERAHHQSKARQANLNLELKNLISVLWTPLETAVSPPNTIPTILPDPHPEPVSASTFSDSAAPTIWQRVSTFFRGEKPDVVETAVCPPEEPVIAPLTQPEAQSTTDPPQQKPRDGSDQNSGQIQQQTSAQKISEPNLIIYCLGAFRVYYNANIIDHWRGLKGQLIFKYLVTRRGKSVPKDVLMELMWPEIERDAARRNLHQAIYTLRKTLKIDDSNIRAIRFENACYSFDPDVAVWLDYEEFQRYVRTGRQLERNNATRQAMAEYGIAEGLYQGEFLPEDIYEDWTQPMREQLRRDYLDIADRLSEHYFQQNEYAAAIAICRKILAQDNCYEGAHRLLMRCYLAQNQRHSAIRQYHNCHEILQAELDISPSEETNALFHELTIQ